MNDLIKHFSSLFNGLTTAYGYYSKGRAKSIRKPLKPQNFEYHFSGKVGLGIVPITDDGVSCYFGAIDIDDESVDHSWLYNRITELGYPLVVCRSKSGGAHLYAFNEKPIKAADMRRALSFFSSKLGFGGCEIFPKQDEVKSGEVGNWINLPYFNVGETNRYAVGKNGSLNVDEFIAWANEVKTSNKLEEFVNDIEPEGMPPCLSQLFKMGIQQGNRNEAMYSYAIFFKKSGVDDIEQELMRINYRVLDKPLPTKEIQNIAASVKRKDYQYKCKDPNMKLHCDVVACKRLRWGVGGARFEDYDEHLVGCLTKHMTDPPRWVLDINGVEVEFSTDDLMNYYRVRILSMEKANVIAPPLKQEEWLLILKERLANIREVEAPTDASAHGDLINAVSEFIQVAERSLNGRQDLLRGIPVKDVDKDSIPSVFFRSQDFIGHLKRKKSPVNLTGNNLWMALRKIGCQHTKIKVGAKPVQVWYINLEGDDLSSPILTPVDDEAEV